MKKILIINLGGLGDMLFSVSFLKGLRRKYPNADLTLLTVAGSYGIIANQCLFDSVIELKIESNGIRGFSALTYIKALLNLRRKHFDLAVNLRTIVSFPSAIKMAALLFVIGAKKNAGRNSEGLGFFYDVSVLEKREYRKHELDYHRDLAKALNFSAPGKMSIRLESENNNFAAIFFRKNRITGSDKFIVINTESRWETKKWSLPSYLELINGLLKIKSLKIALISHNDSAIALVLKKINKRIILLADRDVKNIAAVLNKASLLISNDTGIVHVASALNVKTIALYGSSDPYLVGPALPPDRKAVVCKHVHCAPCNKLKCKSMVCFNSITAEEVLGLSKKMLGVK